MSDSIGETAESVVKATTSQFVDQEFDVFRVPYVKSKEQVDKVMAEAAAEKAMVC